MAGLISMLPMLLILGVMMFFMNRSQKKKAKKEEEIRNSVQVGDEIITIGGFLFRVISIKEDAYVVESPADHSKSIVKKWALSSLVTEHEEVKETKEKESKEKETKELPEKKEKKEKADKE